MHKNVPCDVWAATASSKSNEVFGVELGEQAVRKTKAVNESNLNSPNGERINIYFEVPIIVARNNGGHIHIGIEQYHRIRRCS